MVAWWPVAQARRGHTTPRSSTTSFFVDDRCGLVEYLGPPSGVLQALWYPVMPQWRNIRRV